MSALRRLQNRWVVPSRRYEQVTRLALGVLTLIVFTGAAVRLTGSGLGCPTWPKCTDSSLTTPLNTHGVIEFSNRILTGFVGLPCVLAFVLAWFRRPYRRDFLLLGLGLCLGVLGQAVLGGITVRTGLNPWTVMGHYLVSMAMLVVAATLVWRVRSEGAGRGPAHDRRRVLAVRGLFAYASVGVLVGTAATASGPHAGGEGTHDKVARLKFKGADTLNFVIAGHARLAAALGVVAVLVWLFARRRQTAQDLMRPLTAFCVLLALQGIVGNLQYRLELPAEIVWVHVVLAVLTWNAIVWALLVAGRPAGEHAPERAHRVAAGAGT